MISEKMLLFCACPCVELEGKLTGHHFEKHVKGMGSLVKKREGGVVTSPILCWS